MRAWVALGMVSLMAPVVASAQGLVCSEFVVNSYTTGYQGHPKVAATTGGGFVVVWGSLVSGHDGVFGRLYDAQGRPAGPEFRVTPDRTLTPAVASDAAGNFVVVWSGTTDISGQRFDASGVTQGPAFTINTYPASATPAVGADAAGNFVVVWEDRETSPVHIQGRRFDAAATPLGPAFHVSSNTAYLEIIPSVSVQATGEFVVGWNVVDFAAPTARRFDASGAPLGDSFLITDQPGFDRVMQVAHGPNGDFVALLDSTAGPSGRVYDASGNPRGPVFVIGGTPDSHEPSLAGDPAYGYVAVWPVFGGIMGRRLDPAGAPMGAEFSVSVLTGGRHVSVAATPGGRYVAAWTDLDGDSFGIKAHLDCAVAFHTIAPCRVADTRLPPGTPLSANSTRLFPVAGSCGIPSDARAVAFNATAVNPTDGGDFRLYPAGTPAPLASVLNFVQGRTRANNAIVALGTGGQAAVQCDIPAGSTGTTHLVLDAFGYFK